MINRVRSFASTTVTLRVLPTLNSRFLVPSLFCTPGRSRAIRAGCSMV